MGGRARASAKPDSKRSQRRVRWWHICLPALIAVIAAFKVYAPSLAGPLLFDDYGLPYASRSAGEAPSAWLTGVRPVLMLTYWLNFRLFGPAPFAYHSVNVLLHAVNALLVGWILRRLLLLRDAPPSRASLFAALGGAVFLLHPLQTEAVAYIAGRSELVSAMFVLAAYLVFLHQPPHSVSWRALATILALYGCAVLSKEQAAVLPAVFFATDICLYRRPWREALRGRRRLYGGLAIAAAVGLAGVWSVLRTSASAGFGVEGLGWHDYFLTQWRVWFLYLRLFVFPAWQNADYDLPVSRTVLDHGALLGLAAALAIAAAAWRIRRRYVLAAFGLLLFALLLAPTSSVVPIKDVAAERRMYLPMLGLLLIGLDILMRARWTAALAAGTAAVLLALGALTYLRARVWSSDIALWTDTLRDSRGKTRGYTHLMLAYLRAGRCGDALTTASGLPDGVRDAPDFLTVWGYALQCAGRREAALVKFERAAALMPGAGRYFVLGRAYEDLGMTRQADYAYREALRLEPRTPFDLQALEVYRASSHRARHVPRTDAAP